MRGGEGGMGRCKDQHIWFWGKACPVLIDKGNVSKKGQEEAWRIKYPKRQMTLKPDFFILDTRLFLFSSLLT